MLVRARAGFCVAQLTAGQLSPQSLTILNVVVLYVRVRRRVTLLVYLTMYDESVPNKVTLFYWLGWRNGWKCWEAEEMNTTRPEVENMAPSPGDIIGCPNPDAF